MATTTEISAPAFPPVLIKLDEDLCQCEYTWATPDRAVEFLEECGEDFKSESLARFRRSAVNDDRATYVPDNPEAEYWGAVVLEWNGDENRCTEAISSSDQ